MNPHLSIVTGLVNVPAHPLAERDSRVLAGTCPVTTGLSSPISKRILGVAPVVSVAGREHVGRVSVANGRLDVCDVCGRVTPERDVCPACGDEPAVAAATTGYGPSTSDVPTTIDTSRRGRGS